MQNWFTPPQNICFSSTNRTPIKNSIGFKLLRYVFGVYCIFTILITGFHMVYEYFREIDVLKADLVLQQGIFENSLAHAVWHLDKNELASTISGILKLPQIIGVSIHSPQGQIIYRQGLVDDFEKNHEMLSVFQNNPDDITELHFKEHLIQHNFSLLSEQYEAVEKLGKVYFYTSSDVVINRVKNVFISIIVAAVFKTLLLWVVFLYFGCLFLSTPLNTLINKMIKLPLAYTQKELVPIIEKGRNEIDLLREVFDGMVTQLDIAMSVLQDDFQKQKNTSDILQQEQDKLTTVLLSSQEGIIVTNQNDEIVLVNPAAERILQKDKQEIINGGIYNLVDNKEYFSQCLHNFETGNDKTAVENNVIEYKDSVLVVQAATIITSDCRKIGTGAIVRDITKQENLEKSLRELSITDQLTKLCNRRCMEAKLQHEFERAKRYQIPLSILMIDIDHFKRCNDTHGHLKGDLVLQKVGEKMLNHFRKTDIPCRYGGEEFCIILTNTSLEGAFITAERLRIGIEEMDIDGFHITISIGATCYTKETINEANLIKTADNALYQAKEKGRNQVVTL